MRSNTYDVVVIGGGPAGLAAATSAKLNGANVCLIEREARLGGILKQCIHDGFGLIHYNEQLTGPEYAHRAIRECQDADVETMLFTFVTRIEAQGEGFKIHLVNRNGVHILETKTLILATGCRERTAKQVFIHGTRPSGVFTAGTAQHYINLLGKMPTRKCVILGSGDIGLIMARRITLEGGEVVGVYEAKATPSGLTRNIHQCLNDYDIPLHLSKTVTRVYGTDRLTGVTVSDVDENMAPIDGTEQYIACDALILSVGLIPENELAESLGVLIDDKTKGPYCDTNLMTNVPGVFSCGNALHVNDLVDYVSESGQNAGRFAAIYAHTPKHLQPQTKIKVYIPQSLAYVVPQHLTATDAQSDVSFYFRSRDVISKCIVSITVDNVEVMTKSFAFVKPPEMERLAVHFDSGLLKPDARVAFHLKEV